MKKIKIIILLLASFLLLTIAYTWPLVIRFGTYVAGDAHDGVIFVWALWWVKKALLELHASPFITNYIFFPAGINLVLHTLNIFNAVVSLPIQELFGLIPAHNVMVFFSYIMSGFSMYILTFYLSGNRVAAFLSAVMFMFCPFKLHHSSHFNLQSTQWMPLYVYFLLRSYKERKILFGALAGLFLALTFTSSYYLAAFLTVFTLFFIVYMLLTSFCIRNDTEERLPKTKLQTIINFAIIFFVLLTFWVTYTDGFSISLAGKTYLSLSNNKNPALILLLLIVLRFLVYIVSLVKTSQLTFSVKKLWRSVQTFCKILPFLAIVFIVITSPFFFATYQLISEGTKLPAPTYDELISYSGDLEAFFVPLNPLMLNYFPYFGTTNYRSTAEWCISPGYLALFLFFYVLFGVKKKKNYIFWLASTIFFSLMTLGPELVIDGKSTELFMPILLFRKLPFIGGTRVAARYGLMVMFSVYTLSALVLADIFKSYPNNKWGRLRKRFLVCALFIIISFEFMIFPFSPEQVQRIYMSDIPIPDGYNLLKHMKNKDGCILEFPLSWKDGYYGIGKTMSIIQYFQTYHEWKILSGDVSRIHPHLLHYIRNNPVLMTLSDRKLKTFPEPEAFRELVSYFNIRYIVIHKHLISRGKKKRIRKYLEKFPKIKHLQNDYYLDIYSVDHRSVSSIDLDFSKTFRYLCPLYGWSSYAGTSDDNTALFAVAKKTRLVLPGTSSDSGTVSLTMKQYASHQSVSVIVNKHTIGSCALTSKEETVTFSIPPGVFRKDTNYLDLQFSNVSGTVSNKNTLIGTTKTVLPVSVYIKSAGFLEGNESVISIDGRDYSPNYRGFNIVVLNQLNGRVTDTAHFDLFENFNDAKKMAEYIASIPFGSIVTVSVKDDASTYFSEDDRQALRLIGATGDLHKAFRNSYAIIGVKGAAPGTALEKKGEKAVELGTKHVYGVLKKITIDYTD